MINFLKQLFIGAIVGIGIVMIYLLIPFNNLSFPIQTVTIGLYIIVFLTWVYCLIVANKIKQLAKNNLEGEAEDEAEEIMNKKMYDFSFSNNTGATLSILAVSLSVIENNLLFILIGVVAAAVSYFMMAYMMRLMKLASPERNLPDVGDKDYAKKLMDISDEGERHVMLHGLYKTYNFSNIAFAFAIIGIAIYSSLTGDSQLFSIMVISVILLVMNGVYVLSVRNK